MQKAFIKAIEEFRVVVSYTLSTCYIYVCFAGYIINIPLFSQRWSQIFCRVLSPFKILFVLMHFSMLRLSLIPLRANGLWLRLRLKITTLHARIFRLYLLFYFRLLILERFIQGNLSCQIFPFSESQLLFFQAIYSFSTQAFANSTLQFVFTAKSCFLDSRFQSFSPAKCAFIVQVWHVSLNRCHPGIIWNCLTLFGSIVLLSKIL